MSLLKRLFGKREGPKQRIRICMECGMPVAEHKEWCAIRRGQTDARRVDSAAAAPPSSNKS